MAAGFVPIYRVRQQNLVAELAHVEYYQHPDGGEVNREYRVFISSTSELKDERAEAVRAVLTANCIPVSMENWTATTEKAEERIKEKLGRCDFFVVLAGFRYGERVQSTASSYVEMEYNLASQLKIPIVPLLQFDRDQEIEEDQSTFRNKLKTRHTVGTWETTGDISRLVLGSLMEMLNYKESATVFADNSSLVDEVRRFLDRTRWRQSERIACLVQYSGRNVVSLVRTLVSEKIHTELYVKHPDENFKISGYQERRIQNSCCQVWNDLKHLDHDAKIDELLQIYGYDAPGSLRALMIDRISRDEKNQGKKTEHELVAIGSYVYMMENIDTTEDSQAGSGIQKQPMLDVRGGEMPGIILFPGHSGFDRVAKQIDDTIKNWKNVDKADRPSILWRFKRGDGHGSWESIDQNSSGENSATGT